VAISPKFKSDRLVLAATLAGVYRSTDGGRQWQFSGQGLADPTIHVLAFAPTDKNDRLTAFSATQQGRLYRSPDGGLSWEVVSSWVFGVVAAVAISPNYAGDETLFVTTEEGVFRSLDGGLSWQSAGFGLLDTDVLCIACAPDFAQTELLWVGTAGGGFYRSRNAGRAWRESGFGLPDSAIQCLAVSPAFSEDQTLFAGAETAGIFRSRDGGQNWEAIGSELAGQSINCLGLFPQFHNASPGQSGYNQTLLAGTSTGLFLSADGGEHWDLCLGGPAVPLTLAVGESYAIVGSYRDGSATSEDGGRSWRLANEGLAGHIPPLAALLAEEEVVAAAVDGGLGHSQDKGATWQPWLVGSNEAESAAVRALAVSGNSCFIATSDKLYRLYPARQTWDELSLPFEAETQLQLLALSPRFDQDQMIVLATGAGQLYLSKEAGDRWQAIAGPPLEEGMFLQAAISFNRATSIYSLNLATAVPGEPQGFKVQLWQLAGWGDRWQEIAAISPVRVPAVTLTIPSTASEPPVFLAIQHEVIKLVKEPISQQLEGRRSSLAEGLYVTALAASPTYEADQTLFVATNRGVFQSSDDGVIWRPLGQGLEGRAVVALLPAPGYAHTKRLATVTLGGEVWWLEGDEERVHIP
jgi:photosystem II stability/assembly factor-like uncharacterized protein